MRVGDRAEHPWRRHERSGGVSFFYVPLHLRESCSQFDSLPLTSLTLGVSPRSGGERATRALADAVRRAQHDPSQSGVTVVVCANHSAAREAHARLDADRRGGAFFISVCSILLFAHFSSSSSSFVCSSILLFALRRGRPARVSSRGQRTARSRFRVGGANVPRRRYRRPAASRAPRRANGSRRARSGRPPRRAAA